MKKVVWKFRYLKLSLLLILVIAFASAALYSTYGIPKECADLECFKEKMISCKKAIYINEDVAASWRYTIEKETNNKCVIEVELLQAKEGELGVEKLAGYGMTCEYAEGIFTYPEKNLEKCHGRLKEELQTLMIKKLHTHIIENIGEISKELTEL